MYRYEWKGYIIVETDGDVAAARDLMEEALWAINKGEGVRVYADDPNVVEREEVD